MKKELYYLLFFICIPAILSAQFKSEDVSIQTEQGIKLYGTLLTPDHPAENNPVVLIIAGSGPTDRNGNNMGMTNNSYKMLAEGLAEKGIATVRYDKRGIGESKASSIKEKNIKFEDFINDACSWIKYLRTKNNYGKYIIIGHSEGSLIGMVATMKTNADAYISISGAGRPLNEVILNQLKNQSDIIYNEALPIVDSLKMGLKVKKIDPSLMALFRPSIQPFLMSLFKYNPKEFIGKLNQPILIVQGDNDIQVKVEDAKLLKEGNPSAELKILKNMNHVLKNVKTDNYFLQLRIYNDPDLQLHKKLVKIISKFILNVN